MLVCFVSSLTLLNSEIAVAQIPKIHVGVSAIVSTHYELIVYTGYKPNVKLRKQVIHYDVLSECNTMHAKLLHMFELAAEDDDSLYYVVYECTEVPDVE